VATLEGTKRLAVYASPRSCQIAASIFSSKPQRRRKELSRPQKTLLQPTAKLHRRKKAQKLDAVKNHPDNQAQRSLLLSSLAVCK